MKIWAAEKLLRILATIFDGDSHGRGTRSREATRAPQQDLSQVLRNEKVGGTSERDQLGLFHDLVRFKGPFIYIHDIDEKMRPIMVRDYPKPAHTVDGEWPQFRSATAGKCPFVEDPVMRKEVDQDRARQKALLIQQQQQRNAQQVPRTRSNMVYEAAAMEPPRRQSPRKALREVRNLNGAPSTVDPSMISKPSQNAAVEHQPAFPPMPPRQQTEFMRPPSFQIGREPAASGIQRSNVTSAIHSHMISSTSATGIKAGTSKEVHELKRKVLERSHTGSLSAGTMPSSYRMTDLAGTLKNARAPAPTRVAKTRAQEKLGGIQEEHDPYADDMAAERAAQAARRKKPAKRDPKPGYCENCRDKYDDFEEVRTPYGLCGRWLTLSTAHSSSKASEVRHE